MGAAAPKAAAVPGSAGELETERAVVGPSEVSAGWRAAVDPVVMAAKGEEAVTAVPAAAREDSRAAFLSKRSASSAPRSAASTSGFRA